MEQASLIRLLFFVGGLLLFSLLEELFVCRKSTLKRRERCLGNLVLGVASALAVKALIPLGPLAVGLWAQKNSVGLFNSIGPQNGSIQIVMGVIVLDLALYLQHLATHRWGSLWKIHRVHHSDRDLDTTTALRFHPIEMLLSSLYKMVWITIWGIPPIGVVVFEIVLNFLAMFNHSNLHISPLVERWMRRLLVTPQMHSVHHSAIYSRHNSNFGFGLSIWDKLFKTYVKEDDPEEPIGLKGLDATDLTSLLKMPFK